MTNIHRHELVPSGAMANQRRQATKKPTPRPACMTPAARDRSRSGHISATSVAPVLHSAPSAIPVTNRRTANDPQFQARAVRPVITA